MVFNFSLVCCPVYYGQSISADAIEDEDGHTGEERTFNVGDSCSAVWRDGVNYEGKILFASGMLCVLKIPITCKYVAFFSIN